MAAAHNMLDFRDAVLPVRRGDPLFEVLPSENPQLYGLAADRRGRGYLVGVHLEVDALSKVPGISDLGEWGGVRQAATLVKGRPLTWFRTRCPVTASKRHHCHLGPRPTSVFAADGRVPALWAGCQDPTVKHTSLVAYAYTRRLLPSYAEIFRVQPVHSLNTYNMTFLNAAVALEGPSTGPGTAGKDLPLLVEGCRA
jgi:hypothetical protein